MPSAPARSGLDFLRAMIAGEAPPPPIAALFDMRLVEAAPGVAVFEAVPGARHYNPIGSVHGGFAATILDSALGCAVMSTLGPGVGWTTVDLAVTYVRALSDATGPVTARAEVISAGRRIATAQARLTDAAGRLHAHGTTTCLILGTAPQP